MGTFTPCTRHSNARATHMPCTYQEFSLFATGIVSPRVALFRKLNPTCTADEGSLNVGLLVTLPVLAVVALLLAIVIVHLVRMVRLAPRARARARARARPPARALPVLAPARRTRP